MDDETLNRANRAGPTWARVLEDLGPPQTDVGRMAHRMGRERDAMGRKKYGVPLAPFAGRTLRDAVEEGADQVAYLRREYDEAVASGGNHNVLWSAYQTAIDLWLKLFDLWTDNYPDGQRYASETIAGDRRAPTTLPPELVTWSSLEGPPEPADGKRRIAADISGRTKLSVVVEPLPPEVADLVSPELAAQGNVQLWQAPLSFIPLQTNAREEEFAALRGIESELAYELAYEVCRVPADMLVDRPLMYSACSPEMRNPLQTPPDLLDDEVHPLTGDVMPLEYPYEEVVQRGVAKVFEDCQAEKDADTEPVTACIAREGEAVNGNRSTTWSRKAIRNLQGVEVREVDGRLEAWITREVPKGTIPRQRPMSFGCTTTKEDE